MDNIYLVSQGEYSDYRISAAFSTKEKAEEYIRLRGGELETYYIDPDILDGIPNYIEGYWPFKITYYMDSNTYEAERCVWSRYENNKNYCMPYGDYGGYGKPRWQIECIAKDEQHALKIASERIAQIKALNLINCTFSEYWNIKFGEGQPFQDI